MYFRYFLTFRDPSGGHYGADMYGMPTLTILTLLLCLVFSGYFIALLREHVRKFGEAHPLVIFLGVSLLLKVISLLLESIHLVVYGYNGVGVEVLDALSKVASVFQGLAVSGLLLLLASGYTIGINRFHDLSEDLQIIIPVTG